MGLPAAKDTTRAGPVRPGRAADGRLAARPGGPSEDAAIDLDNLVSANLGPIVAALGLAVVVLLVAVVLLVRRTSRLSGRIAALTRGGDGRSLESILDAHLGRVHDVVRDLDQLEARTAVVERDLQRAFGRVGLVRYNPFGDTGGNQSFALAVLDAHGDGFVVSSLHARQGTRMYAKPIKGGLTEAGLSGEEAEAIRRALGRSSGAAD